MRYLLLDGGGNYRGDFANAQDLTPYPAGYTQISVADNDSRIVAFQNAQQAQLTYITVLGIGLVVTCSVTASLNGTYGTDYASEIAWTGVQAAISAGQSWPGYLRDVNRVKHIATNTQATAILEAILTYIAELDDWVANTLAGQTPTLPSNMVTLAI